MMFGLLLGTVFLFLLLMMTMRARRRFAWAHARHCGGHHHGPRWRHHGHSWRHHGQRSDHGERGEGDEGEERRGHRGRGRRDRAAWLRAEAARRLNLDDHQQDVVEVAAREADKAVRTFTDILADSRDELADAVKGETLDQARLDAVFEKWDESLVEARKDLVDALRRAHAALEPEQRRRLAEWIGLAGWSR